MSPLLELEKTFRAPLLGAAGGNSRSACSAVADLAARAPRRSESGMVLLLVVFMAAAMLIATLATLPRLVTEGRRAKESELAWRGNQYVRAIRLYYRKYGHFPRSIEDLSKNPGNLHFLRKEYKDPMNETDGSWRYIYVGPGGQLIGSLTRKMPLGMIPLQAGVAGGFGNQVGAGQSDFFNSNQSAGAQGAAAQPGAAQPGGATAQNQPPNPPVTPGDASSENPGEGGDAPLPPPPEPPKQAIEGATTADSTVFGGQLVGVASKVDRKSIRFYKGYGKYREWEFIWDPAEEAGAAGGLIPVVPGGQLPGGAQPFGTQPGGTPPVINPPPNPNNPPQ